MRHLFCLSTVVLGMLLAGCSSFKSTIVNRNADDTYEVNTPKAVHGVPVKLKVPTHVEVTISEQFYLANITEMNKEAGMPDPPSPDGKNHGPTVVEMPVVAPDGKPVRQLMIETKLNYTDKVFTVDFIRPAAGTLNMFDNSGGITFDSQQYFNTIEGTLVDKTIEDIGNALKKLGDDKVFKPSAAVGVLPHIHPSNRHVASARFDINDPCWEAEMHDFVVQHLGNCHPNCQYLIH